MSAEGIGSALTTEKWSFADKEIEILRADPAEPKSTVVLVHGVCHGAWCWENFIRFFAENGYSTIALSLRGHAGSSGHRELNRWRLSDYVEDVADVIRRVGGRPAVIGHSMGGAIVQRYLAQYPGTTSAAVLLASATAGGLGGRRFLDTVRGNTARSLWNAIRLVAGRRLDPQSANNTPFFGNRLNPAAAARHGARLGRESVRAVADLLKHYLAVPETLPPVLVIGSRADSLFAERSLGQTAQAYRVQPLILDGMCHDMMLDPAWPVAARHILSFLDTVGS